MDIDELKEDERDEEETEFLEGPSTFWVWARENPFLTFFATVAVAWSIEAIVVGVARAIGH